MNKILGIFLSMLIFGNLLFNSASALSFEPRAINGLGNNISTPTLGTPLQQLARISPDVTVDGTMIPIDTTALLLAGISTSYFIMIVFAVLATIAFAVLYYTAQRGKFSEDQTNSNKFSYNNH